MNGCYCFYSVDDDANTVNCSYNNMINLPGYMLPRTQQLIMIHNNIEQLEFVDTNLVDVKTLNMQDSNITHITDKAMKTLVVNRKTVKLNGNKLKNIPRSILSASLSTNLSLGDNPYECNCDMMWMRDWLLNATNVIDREHIKCASGQWKGQCQYYFARRQLIWLKHKHDFYCCRYTNIPVRQNQNGMCIISHLDWNCHRFCYSCPHHHSYHHQ